MANKSKRPASYDLKAADRKRNLWIQIGLTAIVVLFGVGLVLYIVIVGQDKKPATVSARRSGWPSSNVVNKEGSTDPKAVVSLLRGLPVPALRASSRSSSARPSTS